MTREMTLPVHMSGVVRDQNCEVSGNTSEPQCLGVGVGTQRQVRVRSLRGQRVGPLAVTLRTAGRDHQR